jgi:molybdate transport system substrate-binding protein
MSLGTNVTEVLSWVAAGSADAGIVYATDAASRAKEVRVIASLADGLLAAPIIYPAAPLSRAESNQAVEAFMRFLFSKEAAAAFKKHGFSPL